MKVDGRWNKSKMVSKISDEVYGHIHRPLFTEGSWVYEGVVFQTISTDMETKYREADKRYKEALGAV